MITVTSALGIAIVTLAIAIWFSARAISRAITAAAAEVAAAIRAMPSGSSGETRIVVVDPSRGDAVSPTVDIPSFDGEASDEILRLHQMRYESADEWRIEASTDDSIDLQDDAIAMTEALRQVRSVDNG